MKKEDFRVGNYLQDAKGRLCQIDALGTDWNDDGIEATAIDGPLTTKPVKPIPLTTKWLEKFGFPLMNGRLYEKGRFAIKPMGNEWVVFWGLKDILYPKDFCVHQLQNLYFALTGEELTIKEATK